jgi:hypothetical protein
MRTMPTISAWIVMGACGLWRAEAGAQPVRTPPATLPFKLPARGEYGPPLIGPERRADEPSRAQRWDGTIVPSADICFRERCQANQLSANQPTQLVGV